MKHTYTYIFTLFLLLGCQIDYEDSKRLSINGRVMGQDNVPFPDLAVQVYASTGDGPYNNTDLIGKGRTNTDGAYKIIAISPRNPSFIHILVNDNREEGFKEGYSSYKLDRIDGLGERDNSYLVPDLKLEKTHNTVLEIRRVDNFLDTLNYQFFYRRGERITISYATGPGPYDNAPNIGYSHGTLLENQLSDTIEVRNVVLNDTVQFSYQWINNGLVGSGEIEVLPNKKTNRYEVEF